MHLIIAHIIADYFFQPNEMAINKSKPTLIGLAWCTLHCAIYTACIGLSVYGSYTIVGLAIVFLTHWLIDHFSLGWVYMRYILGWPKEPDQQRLLFLAPVYIVVDNSMHLIVLYLLVVYGLL